MEEPAKIADEIILRRLPFTFDCNFCHANGTAVNAIIPHSTTLLYHNNLSLANTSGCFICHDFYKRSKLKLLSGELISFNESPKLCYQCHQRRYYTWLHGDHGKSGVRCSDFSCHNPHNPRLSKVGLGIGYPLMPPPNPPEPARLLVPSNNEPYYDAVISTGKTFIGVLAVVLLISVLMVVTRKKGER